MWDVFHPPDFLGVPSIEGGRIYTGACETRGELKPAFLPIPLPISTAAPNGDSDGGLALGSYIKIRNKKKYLKKIKVLSR